MRLLISTMEQFVDVRQSSEPKECFVVNDLVSAFENSSPYGARECPLDTDSAYSQIRRF